MIYKVGGCYTEVKLNVLAVASGRDSNMASGCCAQLPPFRTTPEQSGPPCRLGRFSAWRRARHFYVWNEHSNGHVHL